MKRPLEVAAESPDYRFQAAAMLGKVYRHDGEVVQVVEWFEQAVKVSSLTRAERWAMLYLQSTTFDHLAESPRVLAVFLELQAVAGNYRDVRTYVNRLSRALLLGG